MLILSGQLHIDQDIHRSPDRVEQTRKREIEESESKMFRRRRGHESLDGLVTTLNLPAVAVLSKVPAPSIRHEHRVLPVIVVLGVLLPSVEQRRLVPLVLAKRELPVGFIPVLIPLEQAFGLGFLTCLHPPWHNVGEPTLADHLQNMLTIELPVNQHVINANHRLSRIQEVLNDF